MVDTCWTTRPSGGAWWWSQWVVFSRCSNPLHLGKWPNLTGHIFQMGWWKTTNTRGLLKILPRKNWRFFCGFLLLATIQPDYKPYFFLMEHMEPKGRPFAKKNHLPKLHQTFWVHDLWSSFVLFVRNGDQGSQERGQAHQGCTANSFLWQ